MSNIRQYGNLHYHGYCSLYRNTELFNYYNNVIIGFTFSLAFGNVFFNDTYRFSSYTVEIENGVSNNKTYFL